MAEIDTALDHIDHMSKKSYSDKLTISIDGSLEISPKEIQELGIDRVRELRDLAIEGAQPTNEANSASSKPDISLSQAIDEMAKNKHWSKPYERQQRATVTLLIELIGDLPINRIHKKEVRRFREALYRLPPNIRHLHSPYRNTPLAQIIEVEHEETIGPSTVHHHLQRLQSFYEWLLNNLDDIQITRNPFEGMNVTRPDAGDLKEPFPISHIPLIFSCYIYNDEKWPAKKKGKEPSKFWIPLIAALTGCRLNEAAQLYSDDIMQADGGMWVIRFTNERPDQSIKGKTPSTRTRLVPIPKTLKQIGLVEFAANQQKSGHTRLFPELNHLEGHGYGGQIGDFCNKLFKSVGAKGTMHSFRHNVIVALGINEEDLKTAQAIVGHEADSSITSKVYGFNPESLRKMQKALNKLDYGFDFSNIKYDAFLKKTKRS